MPVLPLATASVDEEALLERARQALRVYATAKPQLDALGFSELARAMERLGETAWVDRDGAEADVRVVT